MFYTNSIDLAIVMKYASHQRHLDIRFVYVTHRNLFIFQGSLVFVVGKMDGLLMVSGRRHNADDIVATGLAVESIKTVYRGRLAKEPLPLPINSACNITKHDL